MNMYRVSITEHKMYSLDVEAANEDDAKEIAEEQFLIEFEPENDWEVTDTEDLGASGNEIDG